MTSTTARAKVICAQRYFEQRMWKTKTSRPRASSAAVPSALTQDDVAAAARTFRERLAYRATLNRRPEVISLDVARKRVARGLSPVPPKRRRVA